MARAEGRRHAENGVLHENARGGEHTKKTHSETHEVRTVHIQSQSHRSYISFMNRGIKTMPPRGI